MLIALALACSSPPEVGAGPSTTPVFRAGAEGTDLDGHMKDHFRDATIGMEAWVRGDFESAATHLKYLAKHPAPMELPASAGPLIEAMQSASNRAAEPAPPEHTARAFGELGAACGDCHESLGVKPQIQLSDVPKASGDVQPHMVGHLWAARAMWIGLVTHDDEVWSKGAGMLSHRHPLDGSAFGIDEMPDDLLGFAKNVHKYGALAVKADTREERLQAFTGVVAACGNCHLEMRGE